MLPKTLTAAALRPIVLSTLASGEAYGYQLSQRIEWISKGSIEWNSGTLYPVLHRMETERLIKATWKPSDAGPRRKYYSLTARGRKALEVEKAHWMSVHDVLLRLWQPDVSFG